MRHLATYCITGLDEPFRPLLGSFAWIAAG